MPGGYAPPTTPRGPLSDSSGETYDNGVRKVIYRDPDGNEIGFGGFPPAAVGGSRGASVWRYWQRSSSHLRVVKRVLFGASDAA